MASFSEIARKKVLGVPVIYLAGAFVLILAIVAWRMKPSDPGIDDEPDAANPAGESDGDTALDEYAGLATKGTVIVANEKPEPDEPTVYTNSQWLSDAVGWAVANNKATAGFATQTLNKYLEGAQLSFEEGELRDTVVKEFKPPPDLSGVSGVGSEARAKTQFNPPGTHTVKGTNDNGLTELAQLYYGQSSVEYTTLLHGANPNLPRYANYPVGTKVKIPAYIKPVYYTAGSQDAKTIAAKCGISVQSLQALNPNVTFPIKKGQKVRVK